MRRGVKGGLTLCHQTCFVGFPLRVCCDSVVHPLQLGHRRQDGEVSDGQMIGRHMRCLLQEQVQVVQRLLEGVSLPLIRVLPRHQLGMLKIERKSDVIPGHIQGITK